MISILIDHGRTFWMVFGLQIPLGKIAAWLFLAGAFSILLRQILLSPKVENWPDGANWLRVVMFATGSALAYFGVALLNPTIGAKVTSNTLVVGLGIHTVFQVACLVWVFGQRRRVYIEMLEREGWFTFTAGRRLKTSLGHATIAADKPHPENFI